MAKTWARQEPLIEAHIKGVSVGAVQRHLESFRECIGHKKSGIYALKKGEQLWYVGLASSLRSRLAQHCKDHHRKKWNQFDLYIIRKIKVKYLKELETLLIRVAKPPGNKTEPDFVKHNNLTKKLEKALHSEVTRLFLRS